MPGDKINAEVYAKYVDTNSSNWTAALNTLLTQIANGTATAGTVIDGAGYSSSTSSFSLGGLIDKSNAGSTGPKAYLNWLVFDRDFVLLNGGYKKMSDAAKEYGQDVAHEYLASPDINITQPGYVYIYLSNEEGTPVEVYFDDFKVTHAKSPVVQQDEYYPFGLQTANSWKRESAIGNNFLYNGGSELNTTTGLYDLDFRNYDPDLGRMNQIDPLADLMNSFTPYHYSFNSPIILNDPMGLEPHWGLYTRDEWGGNRENGSWVKTTTYYEQETKYYTNGNYDYSEFTYTSETEYSYVEEQQTQEYSHDTFAKFVKRNFQNQLDQLDAKRNLRWNIYNPYVDLRGHLAETHRRDDGTVMLQFPIKVMLRDEKTLFLAVEHELIHAADYLNGFYAKWKRDIGTDYDWLGTNGVGGTEEILDLIMEYHAYSTTRESEKKLGIDIGAKGQLESIKYKIETKFQASWVLEKLEK